MRADGGTVPFSTRRPRRGGGGTERGFRLGPASENKEETHQESGSGPTDTGPATDDAPANRARGGEPHGRPRGGSPTPTAACLGNGHPPREERESEGAAGRRRLPTGPPAPPTPGTERRPPRGVFKPTRRNAVARYPDRGRGRRREREDRRRDDAPGRAPSRDTGSVRHARPGATARGRAGRRRGALPFPPRRGGNTDAHHPPETEHGRAGRERGDTPAGRCGAVRQQRELDGGEREREEEPPSTVSRQRRAEHGSSDGARRASRDARERAGHTEDRRPGQAGGERRENRGRRLARRNDGNPRRSPPDNTAAGSEQRHDGTRTDEREKSEREEGGGWPEPREATRREPPSRRETDALPRDAPRLLTTPRFQAGGRGRALESGCGAATGNRQSGRRHTAPTGLAGETGGGPPPGREAEAEGTGTPRKAGPRACSETRRERREGERGDDTRTGFPSRDGRGDAAAHDARTGRTSGTGRVIDRSPHRRRTGGKKKARKWGVSHRQAPNPVRWRFPTRDAPSRRTTTTTGPEESPDAPRTADPPPRRRRRTSAKPPSLARFPKRAKPASLAPSRTDPPPRQTRPPPPKDPPAATGPDASGDAPGDDRPPFSKGRTRERGHDPAKPEPDPRPRGGTGQPLLPNRGNAAGEGERGDSHTAHNTSDARTRRAQRGRGPRERQRRGSAGGTARGGHGRRTGGTREPTATQPRSLPCSAPRPDRGAYAPSGERGDRGPAALGRAHTRPLRSPPRVTRPGLRHDTPASRHALLSRVVPPRTRSEEARAAVGDTNARVSPPKDGTRRGAPGRSYAHREVRACWGDQAGRRETPSTPAHRIAREGTLFSLRAGGTDPARRASGRGSARAGGATHTPLDDLERSEAGGPAVSARLLLPFRGAFLSVRGHRGPDREKT
ncbi:serine/arginine repetitive matrix protein 2-like [Chionomys nivalis]|uniref:serine/arginine repetitive matrix protein 2-like n=1 Tax=Chionomys nivalis TaxID=269649 RepID=UPI00259802E9|nr:serine/arginine repetitive matrix protein 2-like [Chionomys nivalis]